MSNENVIRILGVTIKMSDNGLYSVTDLWKASGGKAKDKPTYWLKTNDAKKEIEFLVKISELRILNSLNNQSLSKEKVVKVIHGDGGGTFICKDLVYSYAMWINPEFKFQVIRAFDALLNDRLLEARAIAQSTIEHIIKKREPNDPQTLAVVIGCTVYESRYYYEMLVGKGLLTKKVNKEGQAKFFPTGDYSWFCGYKRNTMLFNSDILKELPKQVNMYD